jgi:hypothetical protein
MGGLWRNAWRGVRCSSCCRRGDHDGGPDGISAPEIMISSGTLNPLFTKGFTTEETEGSARGEGGGQNGLWCRRDCISAALIRWKPIPRRGKYLSGLRRRPHDLNPLPKSVSKPPVIDSMQVAEIEMPFLWIKSNRRDSHAPW